MEKCTDAERLELEAICRRLALELMASLTGAQRRKIGFALFLYDFGADGNLAYMSNGNREDMVKMLHEFLGKTSD
jgi:hypothetical protein